MGDFREPLLFKFLNKDPMKNAGKKAAFGYENKNRIVVLVVFIASMYCLSMIFNLLYLLKDSEAQATMNPFLIFYRLLVNMPVCAILVVLFSVINVKIAKVLLNLDKHRDPRGYKLDTSSPEMRSKLMDEEEKRKVFDYVAYNNPTGLIIAKSKETKELITLPWELDYGDDSLTNQNISIIGPPGTRKSSGVILGNIYSMIAAGKNIAVTDPKGEMYQETYAAAKYYGYNIKVFNVQPGNFDKSDGWDILKIIKNSANPIGDAQIMAKIIYENTGSINGFWEEAPMNLLSAILLFVAKGETFPEIMKDINKKAGCAETEATEENDSKKSQAGKVKFSKPTAGNSEGSLRTMEAVYNLAASSELEEHLTRAIINNPHDADLFGQSFINWQGHSQKDPIKSDLGLRLSFLQNQQLSRILSEDEIDFNDFADKNKKTIIYIICSDRDKTYKAILTIFTSFLFKKVAELADANDRHKLPRTLYVIIEEMGNLGKIPDLGVYCATLRSRNIFFMFCNQTIGMLRDVYGKKDAPSEWETILSCCAIQLCLSGADHTTQEHFARLSGTMAAETKSEMKDVPTYSPVQIALTERVSQTSRAVKVLTTDDIKKIKVNEIAIFPAQHDVLIEDKYYYKDHPLYRIKMFDKKGELVIPNAAEHIPKWRIHDIQEERRSFATAIDPKELEKDYTIKLMPPKKAEVEENSDTAFSKLRERILDKYFEDVTEEETNVGYVERFLPKEEIEDEDLISEYEIDRNEIFEQPDTFEQLEPIISEPLEQSENQLFGDYY